MRNRSDRKSCSIILNYLACFQVICAHTAGLWACVCGGGAWVCTHNHVLDTDTDLTQEYTQTHFDRHRHRHKQRHTGTDTDTDTDTDRDAG